MLLMALIGVMPSLGNIAGGVTPPRATRPSQREAQGFSNDLIDMQTFQIFNCEGMFLDWGGSAAADALSVVVEYDYDLFVAGESDLNTALAVLQNRLLRHVGKDLFSDCRRRLAVVGGVIANAGTGRKLDAGTVQEITSAPSDRQNLFSSCKVLGDPDEEADCYPVTGYITAYYAPTGDVAADESAVSIAVRTAVRDAMDEGVLTNDDVQAVYYLGDRDAFTYESSEYYLKSGSESQGDDASTSWADENIGMLIGVGVGLVVVNAVFYKMWRSPKGAGKNDAPEEDLDDEGTSGESEKEEEVTQAAATEVGNDDKSRVTDCETGCAGLPDCTMPSGCNLFGVLENENDEDEG